MICFRHLSHVDACTRSGNRLQQVPSQFATVVANISSDFCTSVLLKESSYQAWKALPIVEPSIGIGIRALFAGVLQGSSLGRVYVL